MPAKRPSKNNRLEEAIAILIQNQASFLARVSEMDRVNTERFARIEERLSRIEAILLRHEQILQALPEAIRQKIGFKPREE